MCVLHVAFELLLYNKEMNVAIKFRKQLVNGYFRKSRKARFLNVILPCKRLKLLKWKNNFSYVT
jgi:hypothetical protein